MKSITVMGALLLLGGCDVDRALPYYEGPAVAPAAATTPEIAPIPTDPSCPAGHIVVDSPACESDQDCRSVKSGAACIESVCCFRQWSREPHDGGGP